MQTKVEKGSKDNQKVRIRFSRKVKLHRQQKKAVAAHIYYIQPSRHPNVKAELALKVPREEVKSHPFTTKPKLSSYSSYRESEKDLLIDFMLSFLQLW